MEFTLVYQGSLKANSSVKDKQDIRQKFHLQLKKLWAQPPLNTYGPPNGHFLDDNPPPHEISVIQSVGDFRFAPLVTSKLHLIAELNITMLRPQAAGSIVTHGGDIDNRLKTLLDALRMPKEVSEIPKGHKPQVDENLFFCLLEDDTLITKLSVATDQLLEPCEDVSYVNLFIHVQTKAIIQIFANVGLG